MKLVGWDLRWTMPPLRLWGSQGSSERLGETVQVMKLGRVSCGRPSSLRSCLASDHRKGASSLAGRGRLEADPVDSLSRASPAMSAT